VTRTTIRISCAQRGIDRLSGAAHVTCLHLNAEVIDLRSERRRRPHRPCVGTTYSRVRPLPPPFFGPPRAIPLNIMNTWYDYALSSDDEGADPQRVDVGDEAAANKPPL
jgi:hypothetical protein